MQDRVGDASVVFERHDQTAFVCEIIMHVIYEANEPYVRSLFDPIWRRLTRSEKFQMQIGSPFMHQRPDPFDERAELGAAAIS